MNAVNTAIYARLSGDATLTALLASTTSIYHLQAVDDANFPYIVFNKQSGAEPNDTSHRISDLLYQVRAFTKSDAGGGGAKAAQAINDRIDTLLHGAALSITGYGLMKINRVDTIETANVQPNMEVVYSAGSLIRIRVERTS